MKVYLKKDALGILQDRLSATCAHALDYCKKILGNGKVWEPARQKIITGYKDRDWQLFNGIWAVSTPSLPHSVLQLQSKCIRAEQGEAQ